MKLFLQYILDHRYKELVQAELDLLGHSYAIIELELSEVPLPPEVKYAVMKSALEKYDVEMSQTKGSILVSNIKRLIASSVNEHVNGPPYIKYPVLLSQKLGHSYSYLSALFSKAQCSTLERYVMAKRIDVVKQMLVKEELGLSEIAWRLGYCSVAHLSNQFKKITGSTPTAFRAAARTKGLPNGILCEACRQSWTGVLEKAGHASALD